MPRFSMGFKANLREGFSKTALIDDAAALLAPVGYYAIPAFSGLQGYPALLTAVGVLYAIGKLFNIPSLGHGAIAIGAFHLLYNHQDELVKYTKKPMWSLDPEKVAATQAALQTAAATQAANTITDAANQAANAATIQGLNDAITDSFNGVPVRAYPGGSELPQLTDGMSGFTNVKPDGSTALGTTAYSVYGSNGSIYN